MKYIVVETARFEYERIVSPIRVAHHDGELTW
jgi:hypothetical protein